MNWNLNPKKRMKKRGQLTDVLLFGVFIVVLGIVMLISVRMLNDLNTGFQNNDLIPDEGKSAVSGLNTNFAKIMDGVFVFALVIMTVLLVASTFLIDSHPMFFVLALPGFLAIMITNAILANVLDDIGRQTNLISFYNSMPMMQFIASHWVAIVVSVGFLTFIAFYMKRVNPQ